MRLFTLVWAFQLKLGRSTGLTLLILGSLLMSNTFAQTTLTGKITNEKGLGIEGSAVRISETRAGGVTDKEGMFKLESVLPGNYTLLISTVGYTSQKVKISVQPGQSTPIEITLKEATNQLDEVVIEERKNSILVERLPDVHNLYLTAGKKNEVIQMGAVNGNIAEKTGRQIFAKIPGVFVYDMDGSGNQINISTRGLDPHRSWEYNIRQNGVITNSDMYGYPASHYSPAMESIERIELVRGTASLQYGSQFGGMINYVTKLPDTTKAFSFESTNSAGSYGLFSSYNAIGGKIGKLTYSAYYQKRHSDGYRKNARSDAESQFVSLSYAVSKSLQVKAELGRSSYVYQIPGPLTDARFAQDPRQSTRSRNYFNPDIYIPSVVVDWKISPSTRLRWTNSGVYGTRNSVMLDAFANVRDSINPATNQYKARQVDIDNFNSFTSELRIAHQYRIAGMTSFLSAGVQYMDNTLRRRQLGKGTTGSDFDLTVTDPEFGRDLYMKTKNIAVFLENLLYITPRFTISPGLRIESGVTDVSGSISYYNPTDLPNSIKHKFPLFGINSQYRINPTNKLYAGISQAYRPVVFKDIIPGSVLEKVDKNLKDGFGYNLEAGITGNMGSLLTYDIGLFQMLYNNRMGMLSMNDNTNQAYLLRTNIGNTLTKGLEFYAEYKPIQVDHKSGAPTELSFFTSTAYFDAKYSKGTAIVNGENTSIVGNKLEAYPPGLPETGFNFSIGSCLPPCNTAMSAKVLRTPSIRLRHRPMPLAESCRATESGILTVPYVSPRVTRSDSGSTTL
ncbi:TonB-dependent receptor plug domain-containing protein [Spirosoma sp. HMF3257]|uniref:TonB-dependent receptor n=1 Tax=Spirosoma telluris TaxID=2183553 RepID=A0A327NGE8_9BACT|nr:TonB-dependent receptor plug domain-containing protein [Spirosoma telluris]RAI74440.1 TonB-dependent receptor [Spirosoma telluris]